MGDQGDCLEAQNALDSILLVIRKEFESMPDGIQMFEKLSHRLSNTYQSPPLQDFEFFANKRFTDDEVRITLFQPLPEQVSYYVKGLVAGLNVPKEHNLKKTSSLLLTLIYLVHRKSIDFFKEFVVADGIEALIGYLDSENLYERSQAMEIFISFTDCDFYDWFAAPSLHQDQQIHLKLISILTAIDERKENPLIQQLLKNHKDSYPGGSLRALQLLAFWLSWIRALYTKDQRLILSPGLLQAIHHWTISASSSSHSTNTTGEESDEDERKLAETLYEDFAKKQFEEVSTATSDAPVGTSTDTANSEGLQISGILSPSFATSAENHNDNLSVNTTGALQERGAQEKGSDAATTPTFEVTPTVEVISRYKAEGNDFYKADKYDSALKSYQHAMNTILLLIEQQRSRRPSSTTAEPSELSTLKTTLHMNLANTFWKQWRKQWTAIQPEEENTHSVDCFKEIKWHCEQILEVEPQQVKAMYRLINAYLQQQEIKTAYQLITSFLDSRKEKFPPGKSQQQQQQEDQRLFERLKRKCLALQLFQLSHLKEETQQPEDKTSMEDLFPFEEWGLSMTDLILLKSLLKRFQVSEKISSKLQIPIEKQLPGAGRAATAKKRSTLTTSTNKNEEDDDQSFMTNQDLLQDIRHEAADKKKKLSKPQVKVPKVKSSDRKLVVQLKHQAKTLKAKRESDSFNREELERILKAGFEIIQDLWSHELKLKDIYGSLLEEEDLLFLMHLLVFAASPPLGSVSSVKSMVHTGALSYQEWIAGSEVLKIMEQLLKCERIQSILLLMKHEYQDIFAQLQSLIERIINSTEKQENQRTMVKGNEKLLQQFLSLIVS